MDLDFDSIVKIMDSYDWDVVKEDRENNSITFQAQNPYCQEASITVFHDDTMEGFIKGLHDAINAFDSEECAVNIYNKLTANTKEVLDYYSILGAIENSEGDLMSAYYEMNDEFLELDNRDSKNILKFKLLGDEYDVTLKVNRYVEGGSIYLGLDDASDGTPFTDLTVNLDPPSLTPHWAFVNEDFGYEGNKEFLLENSIATDLGRHQRSGYVDFPLVEINLDKVYELCPDKKKTMKILNAIVEESEARGLPVEFKAGEKARKEKAKKDTPIKKPDNMEL